MLLLDFSKAIVRTTDEKAVFRSCVKFRGKKHVPYSLFYQLQCRFFLLSFAKI